MSSFFDPGVNRSKAHPLATPFILRGRRQLASIQQTCRTTALVSHLSPLTYVDYQLLFVVLPLLPSRPTENYE